MKKTIILLALTFSICSICKNAEAQEKGTFKDPRDGKVYKTVKIGNQVWMAENLAIDTEEGSVDYDNDQANLESYGRLYTWDIAKKACPTGWHLPNDKEWNILINSLGGSGVAGGKLREAGTVHWQEIYANGNFCANPISTNESGFTARAGGHQTKKGTYYKKRAVAHFWSANDQDAIFANTIITDYEWTEVFHPNYDKNGGVSVRCLKD